MQEKDAAILLRRTPYSNTSLIVSLLTRHHGVRELIAKGARRPNSPVLGQLDWLCEGELIWYPSRRDGLDTLGAFTTDTLRMAVRTHPERFAAACFCCELLSATILPHHPEPEAYDLLSAALSYFDGGGMADRGASVFALQYLRGHGLSPALDCCADCGGTFAADGAHFSVQRGLCVCDACAKRESTERVQPSTLEGLRYLSRTTFDRADRLRLTPRTALGVLSTVIRMLENQFGRAFRSARFLQHLREHALRGEQGRARIP